MGDDLRRLNAILRHYLRAGHGPLADLADEDEMMDDEPWRVPESTAHPFEKEQAEALWEEDFGHELRLRSSEGDGGVTRRGQRARAAADDFGPAAAAGARGEPHGKEEEDGESAASAAAAAAAAVEAAAGEADGGAGGDMRGDAALERVPPRRWRRSAVSLLADRQLGRLRGSRGRVALGQRYMPFTYGGVVFTSAARNRVYGGQFSKSGDLFVVACQDSRLSILNAQRWSLHKRIECRNVRWTVTSTDISPDERFLIYSSISPTLHIANLHGEYEIHEELDLADDDGFGIWCTKFSATGGEVAAGCNDHQLCLYDVERKQTLHRIRAHADDINAIAYGDLQHRPNLIYTGSDDTLIKVWDRRLFGKVDAAVGVLPGHSEGVTSIASKGDGRYLLSNGKDQTAKVWDIRSMLQQEEYDQRVDAHPVEPRFHWDYRWMDYPGWGRPYKHEHDLSVLTLRGHRVLSTLIRAYFSPLHTTGQRYIFSGSQCGSVFIWDALDGTLVQELEGLHLAPVRDVCWHPHLPQLCSSSWDGTVAVWHCGPSVFADGGHGGRPMVVEDDDGFADDDEEYFVEDDDDDDDDEEDGIHVVNGIVYDRRGE